MHPSDYGPTYTETVQGLVAGSFPVEPWNTWSNLIFVALFVHIVLRSRLDYRRYPLIVFSLPILAIGIVGGTVYHATRSHFVWLFLDFMPILILTSAAALSYWREVTGRWLTAVVCFLLLAVSGRLLAPALGVERSIQISIGYLSAALSILVPLGWLIWRARGRGAWLFIGTTLSFATAVAFRMLDRGGVVSPLPMGTHFLWHIFGGISVWMLMVLTMVLRDSE